MIKETLLALLAVSLFACAAGDAGTGCCKTADGCASGQGVSESVCTGELSGTWNAGTECNTGTGVCK